MNTQQPVNLAFVYKGKTVVEKTFWTPYAFVMDCIALRIRLRSPKCSLFQCSGISTFQKVIKNIGLMAAIICFSVITRLFFIVTTLLGSKSHSIAKPVKWFHICWHKFFVPMPKSTFLLLIMTFVLSVLFPQVLTRLAPGCWRNVMFSDDSACTAG